jgi:predicted DNA binding CopG/RHH family protein
MFHFELDRTGIPKFKSAEDEAAYWDSHSLADHLDEFKAAPGTRFVKPVKRLISMRYDVELVRKIRQIAAWKGTPYQTLMHQWLTERANEEWMGYTHLQRRRPALQRWQGKQSPGMGGH